MRVRHLVLAGLLTGVAVSAPAHSSTALASEAAASRAEAFAAATAFREETLAYTIGLHGYLYGYPPVDYGVLMKSITTEGLSAPEHHAPLFQINSYGRLLGPGEGFSSRAPNNDSIYFYSWLDLRAGPVLVETPAVRDRYHVLTFADFYAEVQHTGRRETGDEAISIWVVGPEWTGTPPEDVHLIRMRTNQAFFLGRMLAVGGEDTAIANALIEQYRIEPLQPQDGLPPLELPDEEDLQTVEFFAALNRFLRNNPVRDGEEALMAQFDRIGFGPEAEFDASAISDATRRGLERAIADGLRLIRENNMNDERGWFGLDRPMGDFGFQYLERASLEYGGLLGNVMEESFYPRIFADSEGRPLSSERGYRFVLPGNDLPPVDGFWSLTAYDAETIDLFPNEIERYSIGDRTPELVRGPDGSIEIVISNERPADPAANWLPIGEGRFFMVFRMYLPRSEVLSGEYQLPELIVME